MQTEIEKVWNEMNSRLTNFVQSKVKDTELTQDIVQDVFLKVFSKNDSLRNKDKLISWIYQIARNEIISHFRKVNYETSSLALDIEEEIENDTLTQELVGWVRPVIDSLPPKYREALILSDLENIPQKEIAEKLKISYSGLKSRVQRARDMLKTSCEQCCDISTDVYGDVIDYKRKKCDDFCDENCE